MRCSAIDSGGKSQVLSVTIRMVISPSLGDLAFLSQSPAVSAISIRITLNFTSRGLDFPPNAYAPEGTNWT
jgi:hypothetical protein